jgi:hypothetical protein
MLRLTAVRTSNIKSGATAYAMKLGQKISRSRQWVLGTYTGPQRTEHIVGTARTESILRIINCVRILIPSGHESVRKFCFGFPDRILFRPAGDYWRHIGKLRP